MTRKKQEGLMDFNDMEHYALDILLDRDNPRFTPERRPFSLPLPPCPSAAGSRK